MHKLIRAHDRLSEVIIGIKYSQHSGIKINTLIAAEVLHKSRHVNGIKHTIVVNVKVLPCSSEVLAHIGVYFLLILNLLVLLDDHATGSSSLLLVHLENTIRLAILLLAFKSKLSEDDVEELVGTLLVVLARDASDILDSKGSHSNVLGLIPLARVVRVVSESHLLLKEDVLGMLRLESIQLQKSLLVLFGIVVLIVESIVPQFGVLLLAEMVALLNVEVVVEELVMVLTESNKDILAIDLIFFIRLLLLLLRLLIK